MNTGRFLLTIGTMTFLLAACGGKGGAGGGTNKLQDAVFDIPVYEPSKLEDAMGSKSGGDGFIVEGMGWEFKTTDDQKKVADWYERKLPSSATKTVDEDDGSIQFIYQPKGAEEHEQVEIFVKKGGFLIHEDVLPGKRKR